MLSRRQLLSLLPASVLAQTPYGAPYNYDEAKAGPYKLPEVLTVHDTRAWDARRRPELLRLFEMHVYGRTPRNHLVPFMQLLAPDEEVFEGKATRRQVRIFFSEEKRGPKMDLLLYVPTGAKKPVPAFLGLNFGGNQTVRAELGIAERTEKARGSAAAQWQVEKLIARGYALATVFYGDIEPDRDGAIAQGVRSLFPAPGPADWGALGAWAFGLSRALDYLDADSDVDAHRVALMGHSRLGKAAVWAGAQDQRFAMVISNCSGTGGVSLFHRNYGETIEHLNTAFPHWFCRNFRQYSGHADQLPVDQHELIAMHAPRPFYIGTAEGDQGADPHGGFLAAKAATPVYGVVREARCYRERHAGVAAANNA